MDQFERWWPWLQEFRLEGDSLTAGAVLHGVVVPPLPYRMRIRVVLTHCQAPVAIDAMVAGDLEGRAEMRIRPNEGGSRIEVAWTVEMMQRPMPRRQSLRAPALAMGS